MTNEQIITIAKISNHVKNNMPPDPTGHDWPHVNRVLKNALFINHTEEGNEFIISLIALTHDLFDHKFYKGTDEEAKNKLTILLTKNNVAEEIIAIVLHNVFSMSFSKSKSANELSLEGKIVQDADRIEAIGAIGIARAFAFGGYKNRLMYSDTEKENQNTTFNHFFEKLIKLYDLLNTNTAKVMAKERFEFMLEYVKRFEKEWKVEN